MKSIRSKLILITVILVLTPLILSNVFVSIFLSKDMEKQIKNSNELIVSQVSDSVKSFIEKAYLVTEEITHQNTIKEFDGEKQREILVDTAKRYPYFDLLYIQGTNGMQTARSSGQNGDRSGRWWFKQIMGDKQPFVSKSYYSVNGNVPVTSAILPIYNKDSKLVGVMGADIKLGALQDIVNQSGKGKDIYAFIIDGDGVVIAHPTDQAQVSELYNYKTLKKTVLVKDAAGNVVKDESGNQKTELVDIKVPDKLKAIIEKALTGETGIDEYNNLEGAHMISAYSPVNLPGKSDRWAVITVQDKGVAMSVVTNMNLRSYGIAFVLMIIAVVCSYFVSSSFSKPLVSLKELLVKASEGDLTVKSSIKRKDEIGVVADSFNIMIEKTGKLISGVKTTAHLVHESSEHLDNIMKQTSIATNEVATTVADIAQSMNHQAVDARIGDEKVQDLKDKIEKVLKSTDDIENVSKETNALVESGLDTMDKLARKSEENSRAVMAVNNIVSNVDQSAKQISTITDTIVQLASQTNLLALNAAIEAARAGEQGKGFAVVAEEVRKLAEQSADAVKEIRSIIVNIQNQSETAVAAMNQTREIVRGHDEFVKETLTVFQNIAGSIRHLMGNVEEIKGYNCEMTKSKDEIIRIIENISDVAQHTSAATQQVSASTEEQLASYEEVAAQMDSLNELAGKIEEEIKKFKM